MWVAASLQNLLFDTTISELTVLSQPIAADYAVAAAAERGPRHGRGGFRTFDLSRVKRDGLMA
jgi:hypothetical protein